MVSPSSFKVVTLFHTSVFYVIGDTSNTHAVEAVMLRPVGHVTLILGDSYTVLAKLVALVLGDSHTVLAKLVALILRDSHTVLAKLSPSSSGTVALYYRPAAA